MREMRNVYKILVRKPEGKRLLRRPRHRWDDVRMDLGEMWLEGMSWIHLAEDRDLGQVPVKTNEPAGSIKGRNFLTE
jgi:hypothetical protein